MGNPLSFPFLCLTNFLAFKYAVPRNVPLKINGDDIVFRATREEAEHWMQVVGESGLVLCKGKTMIHERFFSLNSTFFTAGKKRVRFVPVIRSKALFGAPETVDSLIGRYGSFCPGFGGGRRAELRALFIKENYNSFARTQRSLTRGLGLSASRRTLVAAGVWDREKFYLQLSHEPPLPLLHRYGTYVPEGWERRPENAMLDVGQARSDEKEFWELVVGHTWLEEPRIQSKEDLALERDSYWEKVRSATFRYSRPTPGDRRRRAKLLGLGLLGLRRFLSSPVVLPGLATRPATVWVRKGRGLTFVKAGSTIRQRRLEYRAQQILYFKENVFPYPGEVLVGDPGRS